MLIVICPHCENETHIFGHGGARREADKLGTSVLPATRRRQERFQRFSHLRQRFWASIQPPGMDR